MENQSFNDWVDGYIKAVYKLYLSVDSEASMPFDGIGMFNPIFGDLWIKKIHSAIKKAENNKIITEKMILKSLPTLSSLKFNLLMLIEMFKFAKTDPATVRNVTNFFIKYINAASATNEWYDHSLPEEYSDIDALIKKIDLRQSSIDISREIGKINAGSAMLVHGLYNDFCTDYGYDVFGPYDVSHYFESKAVLFIKHFDDLKGNSIWAKRKKFPIKKIKIFSVYKNITSEPYYIGCHMNYSQNIVENQLFYRIKINDHFEDKLHNLKKIRETILSSASEHYLKYKKLDFEQQKIIYLTQFCYQFKNFFDKTDINWKPDKKMVQRIMNKKLSNYIPNRKFSLKEYCKYFGIEYLKKCYNYK